MKSSVFHRAALVPLVAGVAVSGYAAKSVDTSRFDKFGNPKPLMTVFKTTPIGERLAKIEPVKEGETRVVPLFNGCSVVWGAAKEIAGLKLQCRRRGADGWKDAPPIPYFENVKNYRGSILGLSEDTEYEWRLVRGGDALASGSFRTWKTAVPVAKTIEIDADTFSPPVKIDAKGSPDGWIRYTVKDGKTLDLGTRRTAAFAVDGAEYVLLDDMVITGGRDRNVITVKNSKGVRIRHCDISDWGRDGRPDYADKGLWKELDGNHCSINFDGAIDLGRGSSELVVERCYIHDAHSRSVSWYYAHPAGPEAVTMSFVDHSTVLRWNDFVGSDVHPWNDAVEGSGNFDDNGGFNRDAEIYGNFMFCSNDDSIELDGGQENVRCYANRFENSGCGVSIQGCMVSPTYVYDNQFTGLGEEQLLYMQTIKTSSFDAFGNGSWGWIEGNLFWGWGTGVNCSVIAGNPLSLGARWEVWNNRFSGKYQKLGGLTGPNRTDHFNGGGNTFEAEAFDEAKLDTAYPKRPLKFLLDRGKFTLRNDYADRTVTAKSVSDRPIPVKVEINRDFDWLRVTPAAAVIPPKGEVKFTVSFDRSKMNDRRHYRGAFLVRTAKGLSRPVTFDCITDFAPPYRAEKPGETAVYAAGFTQGKYLSADTEWKTYEFDLPKDGTWYFLVHGYSPIAEEMFSGNARHVLDVKVDDEDPAPSLQALRDYPIWTLLMPGKRFGNLACPFELKAGRHVVKIRRGNERSRVLYDGVVATDACGSFEPR